MGSGLHYTLSIGTDVVFRAESPAEVKWPTIARRVTEDARRGLKTVPIPEPKKANASPPLTFARVPTDVICPVEVLIVTPRV